MISILLHGVIAASARSNTGGGEGIITLAEWTPNFDSNAWRNYSGRILVDSTLLGAQKVNKIRISFASDGNEPLEITEAFVGMAAASGNAYDFAGQPQRITFDGGNSGFTGFNTPFSSKASDVLDFYYDGASDLVVSFWVASGAGSVSFGASVADIAGWDGWSFPAGNNTSPLVVNNATPTDLTYNPTLVSKVEADQIPSPTSISTITVPSANVPSDLVDFPMRIDLSDLPSSFWSNVTVDGGNIRVWSSGGAMLPVDVVRIDVGSNTGEIFVKPNLYSAFDTVLSVGTFSDFTAPDATDALGRNAVWSDYEAVYMLNSLVDRTGSGKDLTGSISTPITAWNAKSASPAVNVHQGVTFDGTYFYVIDTNAIHKYDTSWVLQTSNTDPIGDTGLPTVNHLGDACVSGGQLIIPLEYWGGSSSSDEHIVVFNTSDLSFVVAYDISAQSHEASSCDISPVDGYLYVTDYLDGTKLYIYDPSSSYSYVGSLTLSSTIQELQGITFFDGYIYLTSDFTDSVYQVTTAGSVEGSVYTSDHGGSFEGITNDGTYLYVLCDGTPSAVYQLEPIPGWLNMDGTDYLETLDTLSDITVWTAGASYIPHEDGRNSGVVSIGRNSTFDSYRESMVFDNTVPPKFGLWYQSSWLYSSESVSIDDVYHLNMQHVGTSSRKIAVNGAFTSQSGVLQKPSGGAPYSFFVGAEDLNHNETARAALNHVYLRAEALSEDWLTTEDKSWRTPSSFYSVL